MGATSTSMVWVLPSRSIVSSMRLANGEGPILFRNPLEFRFGAPPTATIGPSVGKPGPTVHAIVRIFLR